MSERRWLEHAPASIRDGDGSCSRVGCRDATDLDRRWLWRLESMLAVSGTTSGHRLMATDLHQYLNETCDHHWHAFAGDGDIPDHRQCSWCHVATGVPDA